MNEHTIAKALEVWGLQSLLDVSILLGILAAGLALVQDYYKALEKHLSLRVSIELWRLFTVVLVDVLLVVVVLVGYLVLNPDIMADIKMAVPFYPAAVVLFSVALVLRLFRGGHGHPYPQWAPSVGMVRRALSRRGRQLRGHGERPRLHRGASGRSGLLRRSRWVRACG